MELINLPATSTCPPLSPGKCKTIFSHENRHQCPDASSSKLMQFKEGEVHLASSNAAIGTARGSSESDGLSEASTMHLQRKIMSFPISDNGILEVEYSTNFFDVLLSDISLVEMPSLKWTAELVASENVAMWTRKKAAAISKRVIVNEDLSVKVFLVGNEVTINGIRRPDSIDSMSEILQRVDGLRPCVGATSKFGSKQCAGYVVKSLHGEWCLPCRVHRRSETKKLRTGNRTLANVKRLTSRSRVKSTSKTNARLVRKEGMQCQIVKMPSTVKPQQQQLQANNCTSGMRSSLAIGTRLYVGGLQGSVNVKDLEREFSKYGKLTDVWVPLDSPSFAFVTYDVESDAEEAIRQMNGRVICGSRIRVGTALEADLCPRQCATCKKQTLATEKILTCAGHCGRSFHCECVNISCEWFRKVGQQRREKWRCITCARAVKNLRNNEPAAASATIVRIAPMPATSKQICQLVESDTPTINNLSKKFRPSSPTNSLSSLSNADALKGGDVKKKHLEELKYSLLSQLQSGMQETLTKGMKDVKSMMSERFDEVIHELSVVSSKVDDQRCLLDIYPTLEV